MKQKLILQFPERTTTHTHVPFIYLYTTCASRSCVQTLKAQSLAVSTNKYRNDWRLRNSFLRLFQGINCSYVVSHCSAEPANRAEVPQMPGREKWGCCGSLWGCSPLAVALTSTLLTQSNNTGVSCLKSWAFLILQVPHLSYVFLLILVFSQIMTSKSTG